MKLQGNVAIITGAGTGLGKATALRLASEGANVMLLGRRQDKLEEVKTEILSNGGKAEAYPVDVLDREKLFEVVNEINEKFGKIDIVYPNAGAAAGVRHLEDTPMEEFKSVMDLTLYGTINLLQATLPIMKKNNYGRIILCSSGAASHGLVGQHAYAMTKASLIGLVNTLSKEVGEFNITVNAIQPGVIVTELNEGAVQADLPELTRQSAVKRMGLPADVANAVSFLGSPESGYITGQTLVLDGGTFLYQGLDDIMFRFMG